MKYIPGKGDSAEATEQARHHYESFKLVMAGIALKPTCPTTVKLRAQIMHNEFDALYADLKVSMP